MNPNKIIATVSMVCQIPQKELVSESRKQPLVFARAMCAAIMKSETELTLQQIAFFIGKINHTTVIHAIRIHEDLIVKDRAYSANFRECIEMVRRGMDDTVNRPVTKQFYCHAVVSGCSPRAVMNRNEGL